MATSTNKTGPRASTARKAGTTTRRPSAAATASTASTNSTTTSTQPTTRVEQVEHLAERAMLVPLGAGLIVRDNLVSTVRNLTTKYRTRAGVERELKRYERRGATARNRLERQVRKTRTRVERDLRQRRKSLERTVKQNRRRLERDFRTVRKDLEKQSETLTTRVEKLVGEAQGLLSSVS
jgi:DNA anti-recombination protein RmuC